MPINLSDTLPQPAAPDKSRDVGAAGFLRTMLWLVYLVLASLSIGAALAFAGMSGLFGLIAVAIAIVFGAWAAKFPVYAMGSGIVALGLLPFTWGVQSDAPFTINADEFILILYVVAFPFLYLTGNRIWQRGLAPLYLILFILVAAMSLSLAEAQSIVAIRTFLSTFFIGSALLVLYLQEAANSNPESVSKYLVWTTVLIATLSLVERVVQRNPFVENTKLYLSAEIIRINHASYRPYVSFFHPSEAGAFMALCSPFLVLIWLQRRSWLSSLAVLVVAAGILVNATRGVWVGLFVTALVAFSGAKNAWKWFASLLPVGLLAAAGAFFALRDTPFVQRLSDPTDLYERLHTWDLAGRLVAAYPLLGVGVGNFVKATGSFTGEGKGDFTADNMFVSVLAENGFVGFLPFVAFLLIAWWLLRRYQKQLKAAGLASQAAFVRCSELALICYIVTGCFADIQSFRKLDKLLCIVIGLGLAEGAFALRSTRLPGGDLQPVDL